MISKPDVVPADVVIIHANILLQINNTWLRVSDN